MHSGDLTRLTKDDTAKQVPGSVKSSLDLTAEQPYGTETESETTWRREWRKEQPFLK